MATMSLNQLIDTIHDLLEKEDLPDEGIGSVLISVGNKFGHAVAVFTPNELGETPAEQIEEIMVTAGNNAL